ncbi:hypothetical protein B566_EDAN015116 [Ephemera danica]|nr:hypothetical protein B566_EDAN015116 [Ephemera danica]
MVRKCQVKGCTSQGGCDQPDGTRIVYYSLGNMEVRNPSRFRAFLAAAGIPYEQLRYSHSICSKHFSDDAYMPGDLSRFANSTLQVSRPPRCPMLKPDAMPTLYLGNKVEQVIQDVPKVVEKKVQPVKPPKDVPRMESGPIAATSTVQDDDEDSDEPEDCDLEKITTKNNKVVVSMQSPSCQELTKASSSSARDPLDFEKIEIKQEVIDPVKTEPIENFASENEDTVPVISVPHSGPSTSRMQKLPNISGFIDIVDINDIFRKNGESSTKKTNCIVRMENGLIYPLSQKREIPDAVPISEVPIELLFLDYSGHIIASQCNVCNAVFISESFFERHISVDHSEIANDAFTSEIVYNSIHKHVKLPHPSLDVNPQIDSSEIDVNLDVEESRVNSNLIANADGSPIVNSDDVLSLHLMSGVGSDILSSINSHSREYSGDLSRKKLQSTKISSDRLSKIKSDDLSIQVVSCDDPSNSQSGDDSGVLLIVNSEDLSRINDKSMDNFGQSEVNSGGLAILEINLTDPSISKQFSTDPQFPTDAYKNFYSHFCKYHLHKPDFDVLRSPLIPRLVQPLTNNKIYCSECNFDVYNYKPELEIHFFNQHSKAVENFGSEILQCRVCMKCHVNILELGQHLIKHKYHYVHFVKPGQPWQCEDCKNLSAKCKELNVLEKSCDVFQFNHITIERKNLVRKVNKYPQGFYFSYTKTPNFTIPIIKNFNCIICLKTFETLSQLKSHLDMHVDYEFKKCVVCSEKCENMNSYYAHVEHNHRNGTELGLDFRYKTKLVDNDDYICQANGCYEKFVNYCKSGPIAVTSSVHDDDDEDSDEPEDCDLEKVTTKNNKVVSHSSDCQFYVLVQSLFCWQHILGSNLIVLPFPGQYLILMEQSLAVQLEIDKQGLFVAPFFEQHR